MLIVADENITCVGEAFGSMGEVRLMPGRSIGPETVREASVLLVRSVTPINRALVAGSRIRFVGSATAGIDHVDRDGLRDAGIEFASAPGCNAESVAQYIAAALFRISRLLGRPLRGQSIGIVGVGHCGSRVQRIARALGLHAILCDPPLARSTSTPRYRPLADLAGCDFLTLHVPLTSTGPDATLSMIDAGFIGSMKRGAVLINACRGGVVDEKALIDAVIAEQMGAVGLDVWIGEPDIDLDVLDRAVIATPHVAGYCLDGKLRGTEMVYQACCRFFGLTPQWTAASALPQFERELEIDPDEADIEKQLSDAIECACPIMKDDAALRKITRLPATERGFYFDSLRKQYPVRREFAATRITLKHPSPHFAEVARGLGFTLVP